MIELHGKISVKRLSGMVNLTHYKLSDDLLQAKTVKPTRSQQVVTPDTGSGYTALSRVTVEAVDLQDKTVQPGSAAQVVQPDDGSVGLGTVTVEAAPLQEITAEIAAEIQHLVPDPGFYGFSGVTIKALPDAETAAFCESVSLPEIPAEVLDAYPNAIIVEESSGGVTMYLLAAADSAFFYGPGSAIGQSYDKFMGSLGAGTTYYTTAEGTSWAKLEDRPAGSMVAEMAETSRVVYSNHDIYQVEADGSGELSVDILYYAKSGLYGVAISDAYRIQRDTLEDLGDQVNRLTGTAEAMTPGRMTQKLEDLNIQLEELTVVATEEVQTITPPSGVYGFSKVIVEAVEDSGGGTGPGGGGEGGEGGDTEVESYLDAEGIKFGTESVEEEVETGYSTYGSVRYKNLPLDYPYATISHGVTMATACVTDVPLKSPGTTLSGLTNYATCNYVTYSCTLGAQPGEWKETGRGSVGKWALSVSMDRGGWANYDIVNKNGGSPILVASEPIPEMVVTTVQRPITVDETYTISGETLNDLGATIQQLTGTTATTPSGMVSALETYIANQNNG